MSTLPLPLRGAIDIPYADFVADPLLVMKKFPLVVSMERLVPNEFYITTAPLALTNYFRAPKKIVVAYTVAADKITFTASANPGAYPYIDGHVEGTVTPLGDSRVDVNLAVMLNIPGPAIPVGISILNAIQLMSTQLFAAFDLNLRRTDFSNTVPPAI